MILRLVVVVVRDWADHAGMLTGLEVVIIIILGLGTRATCLFLIIAVVFLFYLGLLEGLGNIAGLDCHHQTQDKEGAQDDSDHKEGIVCHGPRGMPDLVHNVCPTLQGDYYEYVKDTFEDIVE